MTDLPDKIPAPPPGIYPSIPEDDYHRWDCASNSKLKRILKCPAHYKYAEDHPSYDDTPTLAFGRAYHSAILTPDEFKDKYVMRERGLNGNTKKYKEWSAEIKLAGKTEIAASDMDHLLGIQESISTNAEAKELLSGKGKNEASIVFIDPDTGIKCKMRIDRFTRHVFSEGQPAMSTHVDFKGVQDASRDKFQKDIANYGYHMQGALYLDGANILSPLSRVFVFVAFEKKPPYAIGVYYLDEDAIEQGRREYKRALQLLKYCQDNDDWPGYTTKVEHISVPHWAIDPEIRTKR